jgi:hypothetical protein
MAFSLEVQSDVRPANLPAIWVPALAKHGIAIEFPPNFSSERKSGVLIMKVLAAPASLTREDVNEPASAYFEFWTDEVGFGFSTASGRNTVDFAVQCLCAAALAEYLDAVYVDPQMGQSARGAMHSVWQWKRLNTLSVHQTRRFTGNSSIGIISN